MLPEASKYKPAANGSHACLVIAFSALGINYHFFRIDTYRRSCNDNFSM